MRAIPVYSPALDAADASAVSRAVSEQQISSAGSSVSAFERAWAERCGMPHGVAVSSGTAALELAVLALGLGPGDEVLCPAFTIISCVRAIVLAGAKPLLVDVDAGSWCLDASQVASRLGPRTRAILPVHAFGYPYDNAAIAAVARERGLLVIEDAAQAHGARVRAGDELLPCGSLGDVSIFSFYANKAVTTGEGGMVLTRQGDVAERIRDLANLFLRGTRRFIHEDLGHNYRLSSLQAALGLSQLDKLDRTLAVKRRIAARYRERLAQVEEVQLQRPQPKDEPVVWMNGLVLADRVPGDAAVLAAALARRGVETRPFFMGFHEQPALKARGLFAGERYPVTERLSRRGLYLPSGLDLDDETIDHVVHALEGALVEIHAARVTVPAGPAPPEPAPQERTVFGPDFAEAYDALYETKDYAGEAAFLSRCFERFSPGRVKRVLDLACGTGRHASELYQLGYDVVGVDRSSAMLAFARQRAEDVRFVEGDLAKLDLGETFDAVVVLFAALSYQTTPDSILGTLAAIRRHLEPGGLFIADVWLGAASSGPDVPSRRTARRGAVEWIRTGWFRRDPIRQRVDVAYELRRREVGRETVTHEVHPMHYFSPFELEFALRSTGFRLAHLSREGDLDRAPAPSDLTGLFVAEAR